MEIRHTDSSQNSLADDVRSAGSASCILNRFTDNSANIQFSSASTEETYKSGIIQVISFPLISI